MTKPPSPTAHLDRLADSWVERARDLFLASDCPVLFLLHIVFWVIIIWLLLWPGAGDGGKPSGWLSGVWSWRGLVLRLVDKQLPDRGGEK